MDHRYQVFLSSTYSDLVEERAKVAQAIIDADCFPAGMETFPASGDEQFEYIRKVIAQSDYYVLILGGRYGSRLVDGTSYTEREFEYADSIGLPILVFPHKDVSALPAHRKDEDADSIHRLEVFRTRALNGRLAKFWLDADGLANQVMRSLLTSIRETPGVGWLRGSAVQVSRLTDELQEEKRRSADLDQEVSRLKAIISAPMQDLSEGDDRVSLGFVFYHLRPSGKLDERNGTAVVTWNQILASVGPDLLDWRNEETVSFDIAQLLASIAGTGRGKKLQTESLRTVRIQLLALGLIERHRGGTVSNGVGDFWRLTGAGQHQLFKLRPIRKSAPTKG